MKNSLIKYSQTYLGLLTIFTSIVILYIANCVIVLDYDDNLPYHMAYVNMFDLDLTESFVEYQKATSGFEPTYFLASFIVNKYITFNIFILFINILFLFSLYKVLKKYFSQYYQVIYIILLLTNSYAFQLLSDAHRLKFALVFFFVYLSINKYKLLFLILSLSTHFQIFIYVIYKIIYRLKLYVINNKKFKVNVFYLIFLLILLITVYFIFFDSLETTYNYILNKVSAYTSRNAIQLAMVWLVWMYTIYVIYIHYFKLKKMIDIFYPLVLTIYPISVILHFYRLDLLLLCFIFIVELNRLLQGKRYAIVIVIPLIIYNIYSYIDFIIKGLEIL
jgi:hypothetical protein